MLINRNGYNFDSDSVVQFPDDWSIEDKIGRLERRILVYSYQYYEIGQTVVDDKFYDLVSIYLVEMIERYPNEFKNTQYYYVFHDFDGSTGFDLHSRLNDKDKRMIEIIAWNVLDSYLVHRTSRKKGGEKQ